MERRWFGDPVGRSLGLNDAPSIVARSLRNSQVAATRISCGHSQIGKTPRVPAEDTFIVAMYLTRLEKHQLFSGNRLFLSQGYDANAMRIVNLQGEFSALIARPHESLNFHIPRFALEEISEDIGCHRRIELSCDPGTIDPVMVHLAAALLPAFERPEQANRLFTDSLIVAVCSHLISKYGGDFQNSPFRKGGLTAAQTSRAKEMLVDNITGNVLLADIAKECGLSRQYFTQAFKATTGLAPHRWLQQHRVRLAAELLLSSKCAIADIAIECGFADQSHFTRVFLSLMGESPGIWRRRNSEKVFAKDITR
jgi:AraC family transcriptional regulator